jgi:hypothetical protein
VIGYNAQPYKVFFDMAEKQNAPFKIITKKPDSFDAETNDIVSESVN